MIVVTAGDPYMDIDAYAGCIGYAELLNLRGTDAVAASSAPLNESITPRLRKLHTIARGAAGDSFVVVDISAHEYFDRMITNLDQVTEIIDHHPGYEDFWNERLGSKAHIEPVGAACTLVTERWKQAGKLSFMKPETAELLAAGILDNTLHFTAKITNTRDHAAFAELVKVGNLPTNFAQAYFQDVQGVVEADLAKAIKGDTKEQHKFPMLPPVMGQLVVWDVLKIRTNIGEVAAIMDEYGKDWVMNLISISEEKSYFICGSSRAEKMMSDVLGVSFANGVSEPHPVMLRKEIVTAALAA